MDEHVDYREPATADEPVANEADWLTDWLDAGGIDPQTLDRITASGVYVSGREEWLESAAVYALRATFEAMEGGDL